MGIPPRWPSFCCLSCSYNFCPLKGSATGYGWSNEVLFSFLFISSFKGHDKDYQWQLLAADLRVARVFNVDTYLPIFHATQSEQ